MTVLYFKIGGYSVRYIITGLLKILTAGLIMMSALKLGYSQFSNYFSGSLLTQCILLACFILAGALIYISVLHLLRLPELVSVIQQFRQRFISRH